jgi:hypothetical protein
VLEDQLVEGDDDEDEDDARYLNLEGDEDGKHIYIYRLVTRSDT